MQFEWYTCLQVGHCNRNVCSAFVKNFLRQIPHISGDESSNPRIIPHVKNADFVRRKRFADGSSASTQPDRVCIGKKKISMDLVDDLINQSGILDDMQARPNKIDDDYCIEVYLTWEQRLVQITYPSKNKNWLRRVDCGSYSQFRWSLYDENLDELVQIVVKHNSCLHSIFAQPICKNCEFRHVWHQSCSTPSNVFYIMALGEYEACGKLLEPFILSRIDISDACIDAYERSKPRPLYKVKTGSCQKNKKLLDLEKGIEQSVYRANQQRRKHYIDSIDAQRKLGTFIDDLTPTLLQTTIVVPNTGQAKLCAKHNNQTDREDDNHNAQSNLQEASHDSSGTLHSIDTLQDPCQNTTRINIQHTSPDTLHTETLSSSQQNTNERKHKRKHKKKYDKHKKKPEERKCTHKDIVQDDNESHDFGSPTRAAFSFIYIDPNPQ